MLEQVAAARTEQETSDNKKQKQQTQLKAPTTANEQLSCCRHWSFRFCLCRHRLRRCGACFRRHFVVDTTTTTSFCCCCCCCCCCLKRHRPNNAMLLNNLHEKTTNNKQTTPSNKQNKRLFLFVVWCL